VRYLWTALILLFTCRTATASIFIMAICKDGVVVVEDSRMAFSDVDSATDKPLAYADGLNKIVRFDSAVMAATGQGFLGDGRFDDFVRGFAASVGPLAPESILPALLRYGGRELAAQHMAVAKFASGSPLICGYDGKFGPCLRSGYVQSSATDFEKFRYKLPAMSALEVATEARASMQRYIAAKGKSATMGGEFSAVLLTPAGARDLWTLKKPIQARTLDELIDLVRARKIPVTLVPPATRADLDSLLDSGPAQ
jgi:hypothetical protein